MSALQLLFGLPLVWGVCITALDVLALLFLQRKGFRYVEALVIVLVSTVGLCFWEAIRFGTIASTIALSFALFINSAILIVSAAVFHFSGNHKVAEIQDAYKLLSPLLGVSAASAIFGVALLASGQSSILTATLAGQIVMESFLQLRIPP